MSSFSTSMEPEQTKKMAWRASPCRSRYSPGAQKEVLMCSDRERRQPRLAEANNDSSRISLLRCMVISDRNSSGKSFSSCGDGVGGKQRVKSRDEEKRKGGRRVGSVTGVKTPLWDSVIKFPAFTASVLFPNPRIQCTQLWNTYKKEVFLSKLEKRLICWSLRNNKNL